MRFFPPAPSTNETAPDRRRRRWPLGKQHLPNGPSKFTISGPLSLRPEVRAALDEIELANARIHGYGSKNFGRNCANVTTPPEREVCDLDRHRNVKGADTGVPMEVIEAFRSISLVAARVNTVHQGILTSKTQAGSPAWGSSHTAIVKKVARVAGDRAQSRSPARLDDRQQSEVGYQPGAGMRAERRIRTPCAHLDAGAGGDPPRRGQVDCHRPVRGFARSLLVGQDSILLAGFQPAS